MPSLRIILDGDGKWEDLKDKREKVLHLQDPKMQMVRVPGGMQSGKSSVMIRIDLPNGTVIMAETSMELFLGCASAFRGAEAQEG